MRQSSTFLALLVLATVAGCSHDSNTLSGTWRTGAGGCDDSWIDPDVVKLTFTDDAGRTIATQQHDCSDQSFEIQLPLDLHTVTIHASADHVTGYGKLATITVTDIQADTDVGELDFE